MLNNFILIFWLKGVTIAIIAIIFYVLWAVLTLYKSYKTWINYFWKEIELSISWLFFAILIIAECIIIYKLGMNWKLIAQKLLVFVFSILFLCEWFYSVYIANKNNQIQSYFNFWWTLFICWWILLIFQIFELFK